MKFDDTELQLHEAEKARRRERFVKRTGAVHTRRNLKDRRREAQDNHSRSGKREIRFEINA
jgi:hypothetical protein